MEKKQMVGLLVDVEETIELLIKGTKTGIVEELPLDTKAKEIGEYFCSDDINLIADIDLIALGEIPFKKIRVFLYLKGKRIYFVSADKMREVEHKLQYIQ